jgi:hypothetical protein
MKTIWDAVSDMYASLDGKSYVICGHQKDFETVYMIANGWIAVMTGRSPDNKPIFKPVGSVVEFYELVINLAAYKQVNTNGEVKL